MACGSLSLQAEFSKSREADFKTTFLSMPSSSDTPEEYVVTLLVENDEDKTPGERLKRVKRKSQRFPLGASSGQVQT